MNTIQAKRADHLDILKALGIIAVVYGHAEGPFMVFVTLYHMALFFFASGYFYKDRYTADPIAVVKKRLKSLYVPFITFGLFFGLLHNFLYKINVYTDKLVPVYNRTEYFTTNKEYVLNLLKILSFAKVEQIIAPFWFLPVLFIVNMLFLFISYAIFKINPARKGLWLAVAVTSVCCAGMVYYPEHNLFLRPVSIAMVVTIMFYFGYLFKRFEKYIEFNFGIALACFLVLVVSYPYGPIGNGAHQFGTLPFYLVCSLTGIYLNFYIAKRIPDGTLIKRFLVFTGRNTITILGLHLAAFRVVNWLEVKVYGLPAYMTGKHISLDTSGAWWAVYLVAGVGLPLAARIVYDRAKQALFSKEVSPTIA
jgi:fucose 4-O-acetylase-like acetyltransferase